MFSATLSGENAQYTGRQAGEWGSALPSAGCADAGRLGAERAEDFNSGDIVPKGLKEPGKIIQAYPITGQQFSSFLKT